MIQILTGNAEELREGLTLMEAEWRTDSEASPVRVTACPASRNRWARTEEGIEIEYTEKVAFFHLLNRALAGDHSPLAERPRFKNCGVMLDASRNGVLSMDGVKFFLRKMARLGLNTLMLYTEDTYEVEGYPYFGYMRGRYSEAEWREADDYAAALGIEIIPCIQTLGHLEKVLRWPFASEIRDTEAVLLAEEEKTMDFIRAMVRASMKPLRTKKIHLGMDEAFGIGTGRYQALHGVTEMGPILKAHMEKVTALCREEGYEPMIWSDMPFRAVTRDHVYWIEDAPPELQRDKSRDFVPEGLALMYWDYYHNQQQDYEMMLERHLWFERPVYFAGGAWNWCGVAPNLTKAYHTTDIQMKACEKYGVEFVICTCWQDNGAEISHLTTLPTLLRYSLFNYGGELPSEAAFAAAAETYLDLPLSSLNLLGRFDQLPGVQEKNLSCANPAKFLLYQDLTLGLFDRHAASSAEEVRAHYRELAIPLREAALACSAEKQAGKAENKASYAKLFAYYADLAAVLELKASMGLRLRAAYLRARQDGNKEALRALLPELEALTERVRALRRSSRALWYSLCKKHGYEVLDLRLSGLLGRTETVREDAESYLEGRLAAIETLEDERLSYDGTEGEQVGLQLHENQWHKIVSPNPLSA